MNLSTRFSDDVSSGRSLINSLSFFVCAIMPLNMASLEGSFFPKLPSCKLLNCELLWPPLS